MDHNVGPLTKREGRFETADLRLLWDTAGYRAVEESTTLGTKYPCVVTGE